MNGYGLSNAELVTKNTFERLKSKNRNKTIRRRIFYILSAFIICVVFSIACVSLFFKTQNVVVLGNTIYDDSLLLESSGIEEDQNLYAIDKNYIEKIIVMSYPYIKNVKVDRQLPTTIALVVEEDTPEYYFELCEEYFVLSDSLRVLERTHNIDDLRAKYPSLIKLVTQNVTYAVVGKQIVFENEHYYDYANDMLSLFLGSELSDKISVIDFSDKFNIYVVYDGRFKIEIGNISDVAMKIDFAREILKSFDASYSGIINVEHDKAFVILENQLII